jgi:hypothetical protein
MLTLQAGRHAPPHCDGSIVFAVYAFLGTDALLSRFPRATPSAIDKHPLVEALKKVADTGVHVAALVDLFQDDTWLVEIPAGASHKISIVSAWKQAMAAPQALAGFLRRVHARFPQSSIVLSMEGHGGGFLPDLDPLRITAESTTQWSGGEVRWVQDASGGRLEHVSGTVLTLDAPILPVASPVLPGAEQCMSTWSIGQALRSAIKSGVPRPAVINFANCFNASFELLHTVQDCAEHATAYANYDFYTAGETYPRVFGWLRDQGSASAAQLSSWFALANEELLAAKKNHPTVGAAVPLARMRGITKALEAFAKELTKALQTATDRAAVRDAIVAAAAAVQQYDTDQNMDLEVPDQFMDLASFARRISTQAVFAGKPVATSATTLLTSMAGLHQYGEYDRPYTRETMIWDFRSTDLALNIFFPDPTLSGFWDWRSPYYLAGKADPVLPPAHRHQIGFLLERGGASPPWVAFIIELHTGVPFKGMLPAKPLIFPTFNRRFKATLPHPDKTNPPGGNPGATAG